MKTKILQGLAIFLLLEVGLTHVFTTQHALEESWIEGFLFAANFLGALLAAYGIYRGKTWGWVLGTAVAGGAMIGYIWSRTTGLPGLPPEAWFDPWGTTALIVEGLFCLVLLLYVVWGGHSNTTTVRIPGSWRVLASSLSLIALVLINTSAFRLDVLYPKLSHAHVFFLWQVRLQPEVSFDTLEEQYGIQVSRAAVTAESSVVDYRMKILDSEKADPLIEEGHFALLVGDTLIQAPHVSRHMLVNQTIIIMFPNRDNLIKSGTPVSLVFENLRVAPITVE